MQLKSLTLQNFKAIGAEPQTIDFAPITLLFGPNSAGKSTILQALVYLREILIHQNLNPDVTELGGDWLDLGGFENLVHAHNLQNVISIKLNALCGLGGEFWNPYDDDVFKEAGEFSDFSFWEYYEKIQTVSIEVFISWSAQENAPYCSKFDICLNEDSLLTIESDPEGKNVFISYLNLEHELLRADPLKEDEQLLTFSDVFRDTVDLDRIQFESLPAFGDINQERPFFNHKIPEIAAILGSVAGVSAPVTTVPAILLLEKIRDELKHRQQRSAYELKLKVDELLEQAPEDPEPVKETRILIHDMDDALPHSFDHLTFDEEIWLENEEGGLEKRKFVQYLLSSLIVGSFKTTKNILSHFTYLGPLRQLPPRSFSPQKSPSKARWSSGLAAWEMLHEADQNFVAELNSWMGEDRLNTGYEVQVSKFREVETSHPLITYLEQQADADQQALLAEMIQELPIKTRVALKEAKSGLEVMPQDVGVGISQLLPVIVATMKQNRGLVAVEQPELHVHPAIQVEIADLFASYALKSPSKTYLLETHSEHIILRLLRRIKEAHDLQSANIDDSDLGNSLDQKVLTKDMVSVQYVKFSDNGTQFEKLRIDDRGDFLDEWPGGFFEERDQELFF